MLAVACKRNEVVDPNVGKSDVTINLGVNVEGGVALGAPAKNVGVVETPTDFGADTMAMYGVNEDNGTQYWERAKRTIDTTGATVAADGKILFSASKKYYPASGYLSVYALYPSGNDCVTIVDNDPVGKTPSATFKIDTDPTKHYDIMTGKAEKLTVAQSQRATVTFDHAMAMLKIKVYRENADLPAKITAITVHGASTATMADIRTPDFTDLDNFVNYKVYDNAAGLNITALTAANAHTVGSPLIVFPGASSVDTVTLTIDGQNYTTPIPDTWVLQQGNVNTLTLRIRKFEVRFESMWTVGKWGEGEDVDSGLENNGKVIRVSAPMLSASGSAYTGIMPTLADIEVDGNYLHKAIEIESTSGGVFATKTFNSGSLNNEPMYMTAIKLYRPDGTILFEGKMKTGTVAGQKIIIDTISNGMLKVGSTSGSPFALNLDFGGFGLGTAAVPYQVVTAGQLQNVAKFTGRAATTAFDGTSTNGAVFLQDADIDLTGVNWTPIGVEGASNSFYGHYNGNGYMIRNLKITSAQAGVGLFGSISAPTRTAVTVIENITIANGSITSNSSRGTGSIVGIATGRVEIRNCYNGASISATRFAAGGVVGMISNSTISGCVNVGSITSLDVIGGIVGQITTASGTVQDSYNIATMNSIATVNTKSNAGIVGYCVYNAIIKNSYNRGTIVKAPANALYTGGVLGRVTTTGAMKTEFGNNYFLAGTCAVGVGLNPNSVAALIDPYTEKSETDLKGMAGVLGMAWKSDGAPLINEGYPILQWQTEQWYNRLTQK